MTIGLRVIFDLVEVVTLVIRTIMPIIKKKQAPSGRCPPKEPWKNWKIMEKKSPVAS